MVSQAFGQKKKKLSKEEMKIDSLTQALIDSLKTSRDSTSNFLIDSSTDLKDSLAVLIAKNEQFKAKLNSISAVPVDVNTDEMVKELKQLKELLDGGIINQEDFDTRKNAIMLKWQ